MRKRVVGLGELLWDILPQSTHLGGAPANFAYISHLLGDEGIVASRVGKDSLGADAIRRMQQVGLVTDYLQSDNEHGTGTVKVQLDEKGVAEYEICYPVAWDFLEWTDDWCDLSATADAVCFGSLAQRSNRSNSTIQKFLRGTSPATIKIFDVNLRQSYYSAEVLAESMRLADVVKLNDDELPKVMDSLSIIHNDQFASAEKLIREFDLKMLCITRGGRGSILIRDGSLHEHPGFRVRVADTVGSGDAFTAVLAHAYLRGASLERMNEMANRVGAWVASEAGAMPVPKNGVLTDSLGKIQ